MVSYSGSYLSEHKKFNSDDGECKKYQHVLFKGRDTSCLEDSEEMQVQFMGRT